MHRILPPGAPVERAATRHEYPAAPGPIDAPTDVADASLDVVAALAQTQAGDDDGMRAIEEALYTVNRGAPAAPPMTPRAAIVAAAHDAILDEIERLGGVR